MTRDEIVDCLGTIAKSGSAAFVKEVEERGQGGLMDSADTDSIIG